MRARAAAACMAFASAGFAGGDARADQISVGMPSGFAEMAQTQRIVADVVLGGQRIGQFEIDADPAKIKFANPAARRRDPRSHRCGGADPGADRRA